MAPALAGGPSYLYAEIVDRQPTRVHPQSGDGGNRIVTFRDGPQLMPQVFVGFANTDSYPDLTYQEWIKQVANKKMERQVVNRAISQVRAAHFVQ